MASSGSPPRSPLVPRSLGRAALSLTACALAACSDPITLREVQVTIAGAALAHGPATERLELVPALIGPPGGGAPQHLIAVQLSFEGEWTDDGGPLCSDSSPIMISGSIPFILDGSGAYDAVGVIPLSSGGGADVPGGCKARTGIDIDHVTAVSVEARLPTRPWDDLTVLGECRTAATTTCTGSPVVTCLDDETNACHQRAWDATLWHQLSGAACIESETHFCLADPDHPGSPGDPLVVSAALSARDVELLDERFQTTHDLLFFQDLSFELRH